MRRIENERGIALVMALATLFALTVSGTAVVAYTSSNVRTTASSKMDTKSFSVAEAALARALAILNDPSNNALDPDLLAATESTAGTATYEGGTAKWFGALNRNTAVWTVTAVGLHPNPTGAAGPVRRQLKANVPVVPVTNTSLAPNNQAWQYMFSTGTGSDCDMNLNNHVSGASRLYVMGNLCIGNNADFLGEAMIVKGNLSLGNGSDVGAATSMSTRVEVGVGGSSGCKYHNGSWRNPCTDADHVYSKKSPPAWVVGVNHAPATIAAPTLDLAGWYENAIPGPSQTCTHSSGTPPTFDNNYPNRNNSAGTFELTPSGSSYACRVGAGASTTLSLALNASQSTVSVASASGFPASRFRIKIDSEVLEVTGGFGTTAWAVTRGAEGTTAAAHANLQTVTLHAVQDVNGGWDAVRPSGQLIWNGNTKTLTVAGVIYIDGSVTSNGSVNQYNGQATLYLSGTFSLTGKLCGGVSGSSCDFTNWNPNTEMLTVVTDGAGGTISPATTLGNSAEFQGALYSTSAISLGNSARSDGPMVGKTIILSNHVTTDPFPWITTVPPGLPGNPNVYAQPNPPSFAG